MTSSRCEAQATGCFGESCGAGAPYLVRSSRDHKERHPEKWGDERCRVAQVEGSKEKGERRTGRHRVALSES